MRAEEGADGFSLSVKERDPLRETSDLVRSGCEEVAQAHFALHDAKKHKCTKHHSTSRFILETSSCTSNETGNAVQEWFVNPICAPWNAKEANVCPTIAPSHTFEG